MSLVLLNIFPFHLGQYILSLGSFNPSYLIPGSSISSSTQPGTKSKNAMGRKVNQKFVSILYNTFINLLRYKCKEEGIELIETEESYTSRCSYIDRDDMVSGKATRKRVSRGLY